MNFSLESQAKRFHTAAQGQICSDIGKRSVNSSNECEEAATLYGKTIKTVIDAQPGWCIFYNNEVYWDISGSGLWDQEAQEICSNDPDIGPKGTSSNTRCCSERQKTTFNKEILLLFMT